MPDATVAIGAIGTDLITLTANAVNTVTFNEDLDYVEIISDGSAAVWWTCNGSTPAAGVGYYLPSSVVAMDSRSPIRSDDKTAARTQVKLFSTGTPVVRVQRG